MLLVISILRFFFNTEQGSRISTDVATDFALVAVTQLGENSMFPRFVRRVVCLGFVWLGIALPPATAVFAQESQQEHILFQAIRRGDMELLSGALRAGT